MPEFEATAEAFDALLVVSATIRPKDLDNVPWDLLTTRLQEHAVETAISAVSRCLSPNPFLGYPRPGIRAEINFRATPSLGLHQNLGWAVLKDSHNEVLARIEFAYANVTEGSRKGIFSAGVKFFKDSAVALGFLTAGGVLVDTYQVHETIKTTQCSTDARVILTTVDYYRGLYSNLEATIPASITASQNLAHHPPQEGICILQIALNANGANLVVDGKAGPATYQAWRQYRQGHASDEAALRTLVLNERMDWGLLGLVLDAITQHLS